MADPRTRSSPVPRARAYPNGEVVPIDVLSATANAPTPQGRSPIYPKVEWTGFAMETAQVVASNAFGENSVLWYSHVPGGQNYTRCWHLSDP
jgi:hypothetical protein